MDFMRTVPRFAPEATIYRRVRISALRFVATILAGLLALLSVTTWNAPDADARKKRPQTPTTVFGESVSSTTNPQAKKKFPTQAQIDSSKPGASRPAKSGNVSVFPGAGKRENTPSTVAVQAKPTLLASATPVGSAGKTNAASGSNRSDPRLRAIGFRSRTKLEQHYQKHGREFGSITLNQYLSMAQDLRDAPLSNRILEANQPGGTISRFDRQTGGFTAFDRDLTLRTFFKPNAGESYFRRAATKNH
jgi:hypothetical protein